MRKQALISVSDKTGVVDFAKGLVAAGYHILSTGGTAKLLAEQGVPCQEVADYTGFPEMLDGRVKTLDPHIHAGILARRPVPEHMKAIADHGIDPIDIVCVNLYPFEQTIARPDCTFELAIENIDIGGPTMIRAAAKNHESVAVIVDPTDYDRVLAEINEKGEVSADTRLALAKKVFAHTARYDGAITNYLTSLDENKERTKTFPDVFNRQWVKAQDSATAKIRTSRQPSTANTSWLRACSPVSISIRARNFPITISLTRTPLGKPSAVSKLLLV